MILTKVFVNHTVKMVPYDSFESQHEAKEQEEARSGRDGGKIERKLSDVNTRAVPRRQNELVGKFKMAAGDKVSIRGQVMEYTYIPTGIKTL